MFINRRDNFIENISSFRRYKYPCTSCAIPETSENRKSTDVPFLVFFFICIIVILSLLIYTSHFSDFSRISNGYDSCGNVCGKRNPHVDGILCSGLDLTDKPYLQFTLYKNSTDSELVPICVKRCSKGYVEQYKRCMPQDHPHHHFDPAVHFVKILHTHYWHLVSLHSIGFGCALLQILLFRYFTKYVIHAITITAVLFFLSLSVLFWYFYADPFYEEKHHIYLIFGIIFTILTIMSSLLLLVLLPRINLIISFFEETINLMSTVSSIFLVPLFTFIINSMIISLFCWTFLICSSSGNLKKINSKPSPRFDYIPNTAMSLTFIFSVLKFLWLLPFVYACQHLIISGAISAAYFTRDRLMLKSPVLNSFYNLVRFHLGTVVLGSMTITFIEMFEWIIRTLTRSKRYCCWCVDSLEGIFKHLTTLGYTVVALHGQGLFRSSVRGVTLIVTNFLSALIVNSIGGYVIVMAEMLIIAGTVGAGFLMHDDSNYYWILIVVSAINTFMFAHSFFTAFKISLETVFICFCEDQLINDGINSPYYSTANFYEYMIKAQQYEIDKQTSLKPKKSK